MSRTPARVTQADVARAIRAVKQAGAGEIDILPNGTIRIRVAPQTQPDDAASQALTPIAAEKVIVF